MFIEYLLCTRHGLENLHVLSYLTLMKNLWVATSIIPISQRRKPGLRERSDLPKVTQLVMEERSVAVPLVVFHFHSLFFTSMLGKFYPNRSSCLPCSEYSPPSSPYLLGRFSHLLQVFAQIWPFLYPDSPISLKWFWKLFTHSLILLLKLSSPKCGLDIVTHFEQIEQRKSCFQN